MTNMEELLKKNFSDTLKCPVEYGVLRSVVSKHFKAMIHEVMALTGVKYEESGLVEGGLEQSLESKINNETDTMVMVATFEAEYQRLKQQGNKGDVSCLQDRKVRFI